MARTRIGTYTPDQRNVEKELFQVEITNSAVSHYSPDDNVKTQITSILVTNTTNQSNRDFTLYLDQDGAIYDDSTTLVYQMELAAGESIELIEYLQNKFMRGAGNFAAEASDINTFTITVMGIETQLE